MEVEAIVTALYSHTGTYSAQLQDGTSVIYQTVYGDFSQPVEVSAYLAKVGQLPNPIVSIVLSYFDDSFNFLGTGVVISVAENILLDVNEGDWLKVTGTTIPAPAGTDFAILSISKNTLAGSSDVLVDDVSILEGPISPTGPIGPTGIYN